jgi:uncharacterized protein YdeI (YjbR/CyaY-like superfamily)
MPVFFENAGAFRNWLERHAARESELWVGFYKVGSGKPSLTWPESVDEALCFGWIDSVRRRIDESAYQIRFTPRKKDSIWSAINLAKVETLSAQGRMRPAGLEAFARRTGAKSVVYSYEQPAPRALTVDELRQFKRNKPAWRYFASCPPGYRKVITHWVTSPKQAATRARRLAQLMVACAAGQRVFK